MNKDTFFIVALIVSATVILVASITFVIIFNKKSKTNADVYLAKTKNNIIRVASFNIAGGRKPNMEKINDKLCQYAVDIVGLQEVDINTKRNKYDMMQKLKSFDDYTNTKFTKTIDLDNGEYGIAIATNLDILDENSGYYLANTDEKRVWQCVEIEKGNRKIHFYNTHLQASNVEERHLQLLEILDILDKDECKYKILAGDFNTDQETCELDAILQNYNMANGNNGVWLDTYNRKDSEMKIYCIDNIVTTKNLKLRYVDVVNTKRISDHDMLFAEFEFLE